MKKSNSYSKVLPVLFGFFIMGFVDVVGISTNYVKQDFNLGDAVANLLPMMVFLWFAVFSVPTGLLMTKIGRRKTVMLSMAITFVAMFIPFVSYRFPALLVAFALLGIGNTILQVSLNPLLTNVVSGERLTSSLTLGQFIKAISSFLGPILAGVAAAYFGNWKYIFPLFAVITLISSLWLLATSIDEGAKEQSSSFLLCFSLLTDKTIILLFTGILMVVGIDVGLNTTIPKFLMDRSSISLEKAGLGTSLYFIARTAGTFLGAVLLIKVQPRRFFRFSMVLALVSMILMLFSHNLWIILVQIFLVGLSIANIFSIIFSTALQKFPERANEISGLMIMGVAGGAVILPVMGLISDRFGQAGGLFVLFLCMVYLTALALGLKTSQSNN